MRIVRQCVWRSFYRAWIFWYRGLNSVYDVEAFRNFCQIDLDRERVPDATTLMNFRHLLERNGLGAALFSKVGELLLASGLKLSGGTIIDELPHYVQTNFDHIAVVDQP